MSVSGIRKGLRAALPTVETAGGTKRGVNFCAASAAILVTDPEKQLSLITTSVACG